MKKIYVVISPFFPTETSFRGPFIYDQVEAIKRTQIFDDVIVFKPTTISDRRSSYIYKDTTVYLFPTINTPSLLFQGVFNSVNAYLFLSRFKKLNIHSDNIAYVHAHTAICAPYALALKSLKSSICTILQHHDGDPYTIRNGKLSHWKSNIQYRARTNIKLFERIDVHVSISKFVERHLLEFPQINPADYYESYRNSLTLVQNLHAPTIKKSLILPNGVDRKIFFESDTLRKHGDSFTIGCIANFQDLKGHMTLLRAIDRVRQEIKALKVRMVGSGPTLSECKEFVLSHNLGHIVSFEPEVQHHELKDFYHSLDLFVLPSYFEGFGCVYLEAAACGVPFMACEGQGIEDYIRPEERHLWLCPPNDDARLCEMLKYFHHSKPTQTLQRSLSIDSCISCFLEKITDYSINVK